jgi:hypothetical protein
MMQSSLWSRTVKQHGDGLRERVSLLDAFSGNCAVHGSAGVHSVQLVQALVVNWQSACGRGKIRTLTKGMLDRKHWL